MRVVPEQHAADQQPLIEAAARAVDDQERPAAAADAVGDGAALGLDATLARLDALAGRVHRAVEAQRGVDREHERERDDEGQQETHGRPSHHAGRPGTRTRAPSAI